MFYRLPLYYSYRWIRVSLFLILNTQYDIIRHINNIPSLDVSSSLCTTETLLLVAGEDAGLAIPPTGPTLDAPDPTLLWCESVWSAMVVHLLAGESLPPIGEDVDGCWCVSNALNCKPNIDRRQKHIYILYII